MGSGSDLLKLGSDRVLITENGVLHRLSLTEPDTEAIVSVVNFDYPGSGWDNLSGKTITYFQYQLVRADLYHVLDVKIPTGEVIDFYTLSYMNNARELCEYQFAFVGDRCIARSQSYFANKNHEIIREWQTKVIEDRCTVPAAE